IHWIAAARGVEAVTPGSALPFRSTRGVEPFPTQISGQIEEQHLGVFHTGELDGFLRADGCTIARIQFRSVQLYAASRYLNVGVAIFLQFVLHRLARSQHRRVQLVVLTNLHRTVAPIRRGHQPQLPALFGSAAREAWFAYHSRSV